MNEINLDSFVPRDYQKKVIKAIENDGYKKILLNFHRRAGKDVVAFNIMLRAAIKKTGLYFYCLPTYSQGKKVLFDGLLSDGRKFLDFIPNDLIASKNSTEMKIILRNQSIIQVVGSNDASQKLVCTNPQAVVFSEWSRSDPSSYVYLRPALLYNKGWALFISCVAPETLVIGQNGFSRINKLCDSRKEYTPYNKSIYGLNGFHNATDFYYGGKQKTLKIKLSSGYELECTNVHPIWTGSEWKKSSELKIGDLLPIQYGQNIWNNGFDFSQIITNTHGHCDWNINKRGSDTDFFYLLGLIHADGCYDESKITITKKRDPQIIEFLQQYGFTTFKDGIHHNFNSKNLVAFLETSGFKHGAKNKGLPESLLSCSKDQLRFFLQGLFDCDGSSNSSPQKRGTISISSACEQFIKDLQVVLLNFGIVSNMLFTKQAPTKLVNSWSDIYKLEIQGYFAKIFYETIGFRLERKQRNKQFLSQDRISESGNIYPIDISKLNGYKLPKNLISNPNPFAPSAAGELLPSRRQFYGSSIPCRAWFLTCLCAAPELPQPQRNIPLRCRSRGDLLEALHVRIG